MPLCFISAWWFYTFNVSPEYDVLTGGDIKRPLGHGDSFLEKSIKVLTKEASQSSPCPSLFYLLPQEVTARRFSERGT